MMKLLAATTALLALSNAKVNADNDLDLSALGVDILEMYGECLCILRDGIATIL